MTSAGVPVTEAWIAMGPPARGRVRADLERMLAGPAPVTALLCGNNRISVLALHALASLNVTPAMVGFDDFDLADLLRVTVVAQDPAELGRQAAGLLFQRPTTRPSPGSEPKRPRLPVSAVWRMPQGRHSMLIPVGIPRGRHVTAAADGLKCEPIRERRASARQSLPGVSG